MALPALTVIGNKTTADHIAGLLRDLGIPKVIEAGSLDEALLRLRYADPLFGAVVCDRLEGDGHLAILNFIRREQAAFARTLPVIWVGDDWTDEEKAGLGHGGATAILSLPVTREALRNAMPKKRSGPAHQAESEPDFIWSRAIETGREEIDTEHRKIFDVLNGLRSDPDSPDKSSQAVHAALAELKDYISVHFANEEMLMNSFEYDQLDVHKAEHRNFKKKIDSLSASHFKTETIRTRLLRIIHDWLMSHIFGIDRVMVAKLTGDHQGPDGDSYAIQTEIVIADAISTATQVERLSRQLTATAHNRRKTSLLDQIGEATERLINLLGLAESRIEAAGCTSFQLRCLEDVRAAVAGNAETLADALARKVTLYGNHILSGRHGLPLGVGAVMSHHRSRIDRLVGIGGGLDALSAAAKKAVREASAIAGAVIALEKQESTELSNLQPLPEGAQQ